MRKQIRRLSLLACIVCSSLLSVHAQEKKVVTGTVLDSLGMPLAGASVKSGDVITTTNDKGQFKLTALSNGTLAISAVGYTTQQVAASDKALVINLRSSVNILDEVVVTAFGVAKQKRGIGYAATTVKSDDITKTAPTNFATALYGKAPGVQIAAAPGGATAGVYVQIRGINSVLGKTTPLIIMDGVPIRDGNFNSGDYWGDGRVRANGLVDLNPEDIENISILKGASAAALYGSEGVNGVVLVTTKSAKGKKGFSVDVYANYFQDKIAYQPKWQNERGPGFPSGLPYSAYATDANGFNVNTFADATGTKYRALVQGSLNFGPVFDGKPIISWDGTVRSYSAQPDRYAGLFQTAHNSTQSVAINSSTENMNTRLSFTNQHTEGLSLNSRNDKISASLNSSIKLGKNNTVDVIINYSNLHVHNRPYLIDRLVNNFTGMMPVFDNGSWYRNKYQTSLGYRYVIGTDPSLTPAENIAIPNYRTDLLDYMWNVNKKLYDEYQNRVIATVTDTWRFAKGFNLRARLSTDYTNNNIYDKASSERPIVYGPSGSYSFKNFNYNVLHGDLMLSYNRKITNDFDVTASAYYTADKETGNTTSVSTNGGLTGENWFDLAASFSPLSSSSLRTELVKDAMIGTLNLNYKNQLYVEGTVRKDRTSTMTPDNNSFVYPSVNAGFVVSDAVKLPSVVNYAKLRASWGIVGNYPEAYQANVTYKPANWGAQGSGSSVISTVTNFDTYGNLNIVPEQKKELEFGLEARFLKDRVGLDVTYFSSQIKNQILPLSLPLTSGASSQLNNVGDLQNKGLEISVNARVIQGHNFSWNTTVNWATYQNKLVALAGNSKQLIYSDNDGNAYQTVATVGRPIGDILAHPLLRDSKGQVLISDDGLYQQDPNKMESFGNIQAKGSGGILNTFRYKNLSLDVNMDFKYGGSVIPTGLFWMNSRGITEESLAYMDKAHGGISYYINAAGKGVQTSAAAGPGGEKVYNDGVLLSGVTSAGTANSNVISQAYYFWNTFNWGGPQYSPNAIYNMYVQKNDYIKMREIALTYEFSPKIASRIWAKKLSVSFIARNAFYIYRTIKNMDVEQLTVSSKFYQNANNAGSQPSSRTFGVTLRANF